MVFIYKACDINILIFSRVSCYPSLMELSSFGLVIQGVLEKEFYLFSSVIHKPLCRRMVWSKCYVMRLLFFLGDQKINKLSATKLGLCRVSSAVPLKGKGWDSAARFALQICVRRGGHIHKPLDVRVVAELRYRNLFCSF